jgi:GrpB-like predicted nucleotidyltransferase (UPF0157 family)
MSSPKDEVVFFLSEDRVRLHVQSRFERLKRELIEVVPGADVQHVGSTAIAGSLTKGDLDVQVRVTAAEYGEAKETLSRRFEVNEGGFSAPDAISFEDTSEEPSAGIHLTVVGGSADAQWRFRDLLIASESLRREYDELKRRFEGKSMAAYREAKDDFVRRVLDEAAEHVASSGWRVASRAAKPATTKPRADQE